MRKLVALLAVVMTVGAIAAAPSVAQQPQTSVDANATVTPKKAGTKKNPQGVKLSGTVKWSSEAGVEPPIVTAATVYIGKGGNYNGGKYPKCSKATLKRDADNCPKKSIMGAGSGNAYADTVITKPKVVFYNGGANWMYLYTTLFNPAFVQEPVPARITKVGGKWNYKVRITVPENLQVVAGVPIALRDFRYTVGGKKYAKDYIATTSCPKGNKYDFQLETEYLYSDNTRSKSATADTVPCTK
ncbi:MAG TPA: hypothetical protein VEX36_04060 [Thermoleophilaceae bacterium]|nr:hypothetical protein [Thermoleophilaceae bacterium]